METATNALFTALTLPWVLAPLGVALIGVLWPKAGRDSHDYGAALALLVYVLAAAVVGVLIYRSFWLFLTTLLPFVLGTIAAGAGAFAVGGALGRLLGAQHTDDPYLGDLSSWFSARFLSPIVLTALTIAGILPALFLAGAVHPGGARIAVWLVVPFVLMLTWQYARQPNRAGIPIRFSGYFAFVALVVLLACIRSWQEATALDDAIRAAVPVQFSQVVPVSVSVLVADNCNRDASGTWEMQGTFQGALDTVQSYLRSKGWAGGLSAADPSLPYVQKGVFEKRGRVDLLEVQVVAYQFDSGPEGTARMTLRALSRDSCTDSP